MPENPKTPGVYIQEINAFSNSIVPAATSVPAFIGYTPRGASHLFQPVAISSMTEFYTIFGYPPDPKTHKTPHQYAPSYFINRVKKNPDKGTSYNFNGDLYTIEPDPNTIYYLYNSLRLFYQNGGGKAYIVSTGNYGPASGKAIEPGKQIVNSNVRLADLQKGLAALKRIPEVTLYIFPEATLLSPEDNGILMQGALDQCGALRTAMVLFDLIGSREPDPILWPQDIQNFRYSSGNTALRFGAAYYPFVKTILTSRNELSYLNLNSGEAAILAPILNPPAAPNEKAQSILDQITKGTAQSTDQNQKALLAVSKTYQQIMDIVLEKINTVPPSGAMAGIYTMLDNQIGVWKAPANVTISGVTDVTLRITDHDQENLNVDAITGKSVNALRYFPGQGILVWGARTLDGNSQDWRYISVCRTVTMIEQSAKMALQSFVFEPNDQNTWTQVKSMLENFLTSIWREGALQGTKPEDAFNVQIGLGITMTAADIQDGLLKVSLFLAMTHPAEFLVVNLEQELARSN